jgi:hypothetical protein
VSFPLELIASFKCFNFYYKIGMKPVFCFLFFFFIFILDLRKGTEFRFSFLGYSAFMGNNNDKNDRYSLIHYDLILNYGPLYISLPNLSPDLFDALLQQRASIIKIATHKTRLHRLWSYTLRSWLLRVVRQFAYYYRLLNAVQSAPCNLPLQNTVPFVYISIHFLIKHL